MSHAPALSVLIANYNNGCFLEESLNSIYNQSFLDWEIILVDDASTDISSSLYNSLTDPRIHIYYNETNKGVGFTKKRCVDNASGRICAFMDPDDVLVGNDVFEIMIKKHDENPNASMVYSGMYRADKNLNIFKESPGKSIPVGSNALEMKTWPFHPFLSFKKSAYLQTSGVDPFMRNAEDYDLYYKLEEVGEVIHLDLLQYIQRNNPNSISLNANSYKAAIWHSYACIKAMQRRGLCDESLMLFPVEHALHKAYLQGYNKACSSKTYRLGKVLLYPFVLLSRLWKQ